MTDYLTDAQNDIKTYFTTHDIPTYFYQCFFGELVKLYGMALIAPDNDDGTYREQLDFCLAYLTGTGGWNVTFKEACQQCDLMNIYDDYEKMDWVRSDIFDGYIADEMIEVLFADTEHNDYYKFKIQKERELCKE